MKYVWHGVASDVRGLNEVSSGENEKSPAPATGRFSLFEAIVFSVVVNVGVRFVERVLFRKDK